MANETTPVISSIWCPIITEGRDIELPASAGNKRRIANLQVYCYDEMIKRLNGANQGKSGYFLRRLWKKHEDGLTMHANYVYGEQHEQYRKANRSEFEKKHRKGDIEFRKNGSGAWGVYSDWLYDTYQKDWSKAFQLTFYGFFRNIDYLSHNGNDKFFSHTRINPRFRYANPDGSLSFLWLFSEMGICQLGEVIKLDAENLRVSGKLSAMQGLPKHDKAILYCILGGVYHRGRYPGEDMYGLGHDAAFWPSAEHDFLKCLASEAFAHIAAAAIVNANAFQAVKTYLPNVHGMFVEMLETLTLGLGECEVLEEYEVNNSGGLKTSEDKYYPPSLFKEGKHLFFNRKYIMEQGFDKGNVSEAKILDAIKNDKGLHNEGVAKTYMNHRWLIIAMAQHHLHVSTNEITKKLKPFEERDELNYVDPHFFTSATNKKYVYQGLYTSEHNMGYDFAKLSNYWKPRNNIMPLRLKTQELINLEHNKKPSELVIHLHPLKEEFRGRDYPTMFSDTDQYDYIRRPDNFPRYAPLWIGIELFIGPNNEYYADTYISRDWVAENDYGKYIQVRVGLINVIPALHMERIEAKELFPKDHSNSNKIKIIKMVE